MDTLYLNTGRTNQKWRTREALMKASMELIQRGMTPTVAEVADAARVARTTAYRYFPTQELLLAGSALYASNSAPGMGIDDAAASPGTPADRVDAVIQADWANTTLNEVSFRAYLGSAVREGASARPANRLRWFGTALEEAKGKLSKDDLKRLTAALSLCSGIESLVVLRDICRLSEEEALDVKRWMARALVEAALAGRGGTPVRRSRVKKKRT